VICPDSAQYISYGLTAKGLNADYKTFAVVFATRLQRVLPKCVSSDQTGCIKGRSAFSKIRNAIDAINFSNDNNNHGILPYIDFRKAFDTVNWKFMIKVLQHLNFS
jgi:hypothetical protein